ncbi:MAG TPA: sigma-70 family RNA polymerase sigma factor [Phototrophicaceae bacterium]|jgi:RNA polymerase sigma-70 factor (ECF subfamily)|nr:sigma-70 family RNA polymerase sigma factor [Phototrophicaceae bacterium]
MDFTLSQEPPLVLDILPAAIDVADLDLAAMYDRYFAQVYNYLRYRVQDARTADDLTAQVFERVVQYRHRYQPERAAFNTWLFAIARHVVSDHYRAQKRRRWMPFDLLRHHPTDAPEPEKTVIRNESNTHLLQAVARLGDREREVIALRFGAGLTNRQIATMTGLTENNIGVILHRALRRLRVQLESEGINNHE